MRYFRSSNGSLQSKARIYSQEDHCIDISCIDREALAIVNRLVSQGYSAYIVGGAVRDLLLGRRPKDFDIVTDALPNRIRKIFSNSRIIGRRFKLVHV
ncbi:MAG TPA: polynucleotide adenylyltransferase PcnB, partial [Rectinema sp.]|nr:polynucleotide adenylyltransferase PcnB [Rectinema sp.]